MTVLLALISLTAIFASALMGGLAPLLVSTPSARLMRLGNSFAAGILASVALVHLLPAAHDAVLAARGPRPFPLDGAATLAGTCAVFLLDIVLRARTRPTMTSSEDEPLLPSKRNGHLGVAAVLAGSLCVHAIVEGLSLGAMLSDSRRFAMISAAVLAHKVFAALALGSSLAGAVEKSVEGRQEAKRAALATAVLFACLTPLGALVGVLLVSVAGFQATLGAALLNCVSAGVFVYVALVDLLAEELRAVSESRCEREADVGVRAGVFVVAAGAMTVLGVWT